MRLRHLALPAAAGLTLLALPFAPAAVAAAPACDPSVNSCTALFDYTGAAQSFTVPAGVTNVLVALGGASGGDGLDVDRVVPSGGQGGALEAIVPVTPGQVLTLVVGGKGGDAVLTEQGDTPPPPAAGGYGGGGAGTSALDGPVGGGGGGSFLYAGSTLLAAVGGGGGAGYTGFGDDTADGGAGGASAAGTAAAGTDGGGGASTSAGGAAGGGNDSTAGSGPATSAATVGAGGAAAGGCSAGGGGGGYFGGGSGGCTYIPVQAKATGQTGATKARTATAAADAAPAAADQRIQYSGGGGGGAGFLGKGVSQVAEFGDGTSGLDDGVIALGYTTAATTTTLTTGVTTLAPGQEATLDAAVAGPDLTIGTPSDADSPAGKTAAAAFGASAQAKALAVPAQPAAPGTTITPGTACGSTPCTVTFFVNGTQLGDPITVDAATGVASVIFTAGSDEGVRSITARYDGNLYYLQSTSDPLSLTVAGLANTGPSNVGPMLGASAALLVAGAGLVAYGRRRPQLGSHRAA